MGGDNKLFWKSADRYFVHNTATKMKSLVDLNKAVESVDPTFLSGKILVIVVHNIIL